MKNTRILVMLFVLGSLSMACKKPAGDKATTGEEANVSSAVGENMKVDTDLSQVLWEGSKPTGTHKGFVKLSEGTLTVDKGKITGGNFIMDMKSISSTDLEGGMKDNLEAHLKGTAEGKEDDFFNVNVYQTAKFEITKISSLTSDPNATHLVYGNLTIREQAKEIGFKANIDMTDSGVNVTTPPFTINRTDWGIKFMSKSFFDNLKDKFINDDIGISIQLVAKP